MTTCWHCWPTLLYFVNSESIATAKTTSTCWHSWPLTMFTLYFIQSKQLWRLSLQSRFFPFDIALLTYIYLPRVLCKLSNVKCQLNPNQFNCKDYLYTLTLLTYIYLRCTLSTRCLLSTFERTVKATSPLNVDAISTTAAALFYHYECD